MFVPRVVYQILYRVTLEFEAATKAGNYIIHESRTNAIKCYLAFEFARLYNAEINEVSLIPRKYTQKESNRARN